MSGLADVLSELRSLNKTVSDSNTIMRDSVSLHDKQIETLTQANYDLENRIKTLEIKAAKDEGREEAEEKQRKFLENNWHKFLSVFIMAIPLLSALYWLLPNFTKVTIAE